MAKGFFVGVGGVAKKASAVYVGVNGVARKVTKGYVGVNGVARQFYPAVDPVNIFTQASGVNTSAVTNLTASFTYKTSSGTNYTMTQMARSGSSPSYYWSGSLSSSDGTSEKCLYTCSSNTLTVTNHESLKCTFEYKYTKSGSTDGPIYFGVVASGTTSCKSSELTSSFLAYKNFTPTNTTSYIEYTFTVNISSLTGTNRRLLFIQPWANMNGSSNIRIKKIWLE